MHKSTLATVRSIGRLLGNFVCATAITTFRQAKRAVMLLSERLRLSWCKRGAERARLALGEKLREQGRGDADLRRQIVAVEQTEGSPASKAKRSRAQRRKQEELLRQLADGLLRLPEPPPGLGVVYRDFRRALAKVGESRRRIASAWVGLWPTNWRERFQVALGGTFLAALLFAATLPFRAPHGEAELAAEGTAAETPSDGVAMRSEPPTPNAQRNDPPKPPPIPVDRPDPTPTRGMTEKLDVDLRTDPRKDFEVHGPVEYAMGRLTLGPAGSVRRVLDVGSQARLTLNLEFTPLREDGQTSTTRFAFQIRDRGEFVVLIVRRREKGNTLGELRLIDQDTPYGGRTARTLEKASQTLRVYLARRFRRWTLDVPAPSWLADGLPWQQADGSRLCGQGTQASPG